MEINIDNYISEDEKREIALEIFRDKVKEAFGGDQYTDSGKERDRVIRNAVYHWIVEYVEKTLTEEDKEAIRTNALNAIKDANYEFQVFKKPDVWDRTEYTAYKVITQAVKENEDFIKEKVTEAIIKRFSNPSTEELKVLDSK